MSTRAKHPIERFKVVIIGGGASGLGAAQKLIENGITDTVLLEGMDRLGGRIHSVPHDNNYLEYGAQWIHGEDGNIVYELAKAQNVLDNVHSLKQTGFEQTRFIREDCSVVDGDVIEKFLMLFETLTQEAEASVLPTYTDSVGKYYEDKFKVKNEWGELGLELLDWYARFQCCVDGTDTWFDTSGVGSCAYEECPGSQVNNWSNGYVDFIKILKESIPEENIRLNCPVRKVYWKIPHKSLVEVELESGQKIEANHIIVTSSIGVLKRNHKSMFEPPLPSSTVNAIKGLGISVVDKIYLKFPQKWWGDCEGFSFLRKEPPLQINSQNWEKEIMGFYEVRKQPTMLCGWLTGEAAKMMELEDVETVKKKCVRLLRHYLHSSMEVPDAVWCDRTQWHNNPFICGAYSFRPVGIDNVNSLPVDLSAPLSNYNGCPVLCFAGEATHKIYYSTVHGALESGWSQANIISEYLSFLNICF